MTNRLLTHFALAGLLVVLVSPVLAQTSQTQINDSKKGSSPPQFPTQGHVSDHPTARQSQPVSGHWPGRQINLLSYYVARFQVAFTNDSVWEREKVAEMLDQWRLKVQQGQFPPSEAAMKMFDDPVEKSLYQTLIREYTDGVLLSDLKEGETYSNRVKTYCKSVTSEEYRKTLGYTETVKVLREWCREQLDALPDPERAKMTAEIAYRLQRCNRLPLQFLSKIDVKEIGWQHVFLRNSDATKEILAQEDEIVQAILDAGDEKFPPPPDNLSRLAKLRWQFLNLLFTETDIFKNPSEHFSNQKCADLSSLYDHNLHEHPLLREIKKELLAPKKDTEKGMK